MCNIINPFAHGFFSSLPEQTIFISTQQPTGYPRTSSTTASRCGVFGNKSKSAALLTM